MIKLNVPYCVHISNPAPGPYYNGAGSTTFPNPQTGSQESLTGRNQPLYDTMLAVVNENTFQVRVRLHVFDANGVRKKWNGTQDYGEVQLPARRSFAMSFVPFNPIYFPDPPRDFVGRAVIEVIRDTPFTPDPVANIYAKAYIGGGRPTPHWWNEISYQVPVLTDPVPVQGAKVFEYGIKYRDIDHTQFAYERSNAQCAFNGVTYDMPWLSGTVYEDRAYTTGIAITNYEAVSKTFDLRYTVGHNPGYLNPGEVFTGSITVPAGQTIVTSLYDKFAGYDPAVRNSEGHLVLTPVGGACKYGSVLIAYNESGNIFGFGVS